MSADESTRETVGKGLRTNSVGLFGNVMIGLSSTAPAYSLAATLGYIVLVVNDKAPAMLLLAFFPMLFVAFGTRELSNDTPDCGTNFTWATKAFGPWIGWITGWAVAISSIICMADVAEISAVYLLKFLHLDPVAESTIARVAVGCSVILVMGWVSIRGINLSERVVNLLVMTQLVVLFLASGIALVKVYAQAAGPQAVLPSLDWINPFELTTSQLAQGMILCVFLYWGWDACLSINEESKDPGRNPGLAAVLTTVILLLTFLVTAYAIQSFAGFGAEGIGLNNPENSDDILTVLGGPVGGTILASILVLTVSISAITSTQTTILPASRGTLSMAVYEALPARFSNVHSRYMTPVFGTSVMVGVSLIFYIVLSIVSDDALADSLASLGLAVAFYEGITAFACVWYFRRTLTASVRNLFLRGVLPFIGGCVMVWAFVQSSIDMISPTYGFTSFGPIGGVFVIGVGMLVLGVPLMLACFAFGAKPYFRGETLNAQTEVKAPDVY